VFWIADCGPLESSTFNLQPKTLLLQAGNGKGGCGTKGGFPAWNWD
jgi:hypothetical protein